MTSDSSEANISSPPKWWGQGTILGNFSSKFDPNANDPKPIAIAYNGEHFIIKAPELSVALTPEEFAQAFDLPEIFLGNRRLSLSEGTEPKFAKELEADCGVPGKYVRKGQYLAFIDPSGGCSLTLEPAHSAMLAEDFGFSLLCVRRALTGAVRFFIIQANSTGLHSFF